VSHVAFLVKGGILQATTIDNINYFIAAIINGLLGSRATILILTALTITGTGIGTNVDLDGALANHLALDAIDNIILFLDTEGVT
jgi:hypothetical protein